MQNFFICLRKNLLISVRYFVFFNTIKCLFLYFQTIKYPLVGQKSSPSLAFCFIFSFRVLPVTPFPLLERKYLLQICSYQLLKNFIIIIIIVIYNLQQLFNKKRKKFKVNKLKYTIEMLVREVSVVYYLRSIQNLVSLACLCWTHVRHLLDMYWTLNECVRHQLYKVNMGPTLVEHVSYT